MFVELRKFKVSELLFLRICFSKTYTAFAKLESCEFLPSNTVTKASLEASTGL